MTVAENKNVPKQALNELTSILKKLYQDASNVCKGTVKMTDSRFAPSAKAADRAY